jgi:hypothetical protein
MTTWGGGAARAPPQCRLTASSETAICGKLVVALAARPGVDW